MVTPAGILKQLRLRNDPEYAEKLAAKEAKEKADYEALSDEEKCFLKLKTPPKKTAEEILAFLREIYKD